MKKFCLLTALAILFLATPVNAQTNGVKFLVSWRSDAYVPSWYAGKILPSPGSNVNISFELIDGDKVADISQKEIRWFANDILFQKGFGLKSVKYAVPGIRTSSSQKIKIVVAGYKGADVFKYVDIPVVNPEVVIQAPFAQKVLGAGKHTLTSLFYFWDIRNLSEILLEWSYNGAETSSSGENNSLEVEIPTTASGGAFQIGVIATKIGDETILAKASASLSIK